MRIVFRNLEKSEFVKEAVEQRLGEMVEKFPKLQNHKITVTVYMENSPQQPGPDSFGVKVVILGKFFKFISLCKTSGSIYGALAEVREHLLEVLNRTSDKARVKKRARERKLQIAI